MSQIKKRKCSSLQELHAVLLDTLLVFDKICQRRGITYFLDGGTELGAVREQGFIPWDDDIDIKIFHKDCKKLKAALQMDLPDRYRLVEPEDELPHFFDFVPRVVDQEVIRTGDAEEEQDHFQDHAGIDIFFIDRIPDSTFLQKAHKFRLKVFYGMAMSRRENLEFEKYSLLESIEVRMLTCIGRLLPLRTILFLYDWESQRYQHQDTNSAMHSNAPLSYFNTVPWHACDSALRIPFEGVLLPIPIGYDPELTVYYQDWRVPRRDTSKYISHTDLEA